MANKLGWSSYLNSKFIPNSEDEEFFDSLPPLPSPPSRYFYEGSGGFQGSEESAGGAFMDGLTAEICGLPSVHSPIRRPIYRRPSTTIKVEEPELVSLLCMENWDDIVREREEVVGGDWWLRFSPLLQRMVENMFPILKGLP